VKTASVIMEQPVETIHYLLGALNPWTTKPKPFTYMQKRRQGPYCTIPSCIGFISLMAVVCLLQVKQAVEDGYDLRGYHYWTLLDDYEFNYGYDLKFGLYAWDPKDTDSRRTERAGAKVSIPSLAVNLRNRKHKR